MSLTEAIEALSSIGDEAKLLAGGQSLGPLLNLRLASPQVLIDLERVEELSAPPKEDGNAIALAAMTRQRTIETSSLVQSWSPLLAQAVPFVAHRTIRNRGTLGGSLAHADPAAELPAVAVAAGATITVLGPTGPRLVMAEEFFQGFFTTSLEPTELISSVHFPKVMPGEGTSWMEFAPRRGDFALVGVAARIRLSTEGTIDDARLVYSGVSDSPWCDDEVSSSLRGSRPSEDVFLSAARSAADNCQATEDSTASAAYRKSLMAHLGVQALVAATDEGRIRL